MRDIKFTGKNIEITKPMKESVNQKLSFLNKFLEDTDSVKVTVSYRKTKFKISVVVYTFNKVIKIEREVKDFYEGLDIIAEKLKNTVMRQHEFRVKQNREKLVERTVEGIQENEDIDDEPIIEVHKKVVCTELTEEEVIEEMEET